MRKYLIFLFLFACANQPTKELIESSDYGPKPKDYKNLVITYMQTTLKDPDSAKYNWNREPTKMWVVNPHGSGHLFGWGTCALINAKNGFGGFSGFQKYFFFFKDNQIKAFQKDEFDIYCSNGFNEVK